MEIKSLRPFPAIFAVLLLAQASQMNASEAMGTTPAEPFTSAEYASAILKTTQDATVHATVGPAHTPLSIELSNFFLDHPDLSAFIVHRQNIAPYRIVMQGPRRSLADDGEGTVGIVNLISATDHRRLYYGEGIHHSALFPDIHASAVIVMELKDEIGPDHRPMTQTTFDVYVRMKNRFVASVVKALRPFLQKTVVGKFSKAFFVADQVGRLTANNPATVIGEASTYPLIFTEDRERLIRMISELTPSTQNPTTKSPPQD